MAFLGFDSLDALRLSLTSRLGESASGRTREEVGPMIGRLLLDEARNNERRIASVRIALAGLFFAIAVTSGATNSSSTVLGAAAAWMASAVLLYVALRRGWYRNWLRKLIPTCDALGVVIGAALVTRHASAVNAHAAMIGNAALVCAFLVFTGALRLTRASALYCSILAVAAFALVASITHLRLVATLGVIGGLVASSALASRITEVIRRVIQTEVGRIEMERQVERANVLLAHAEAANSAREEVLRIVAHDLRNPLSTLLMSADLLIDPSISAQAHAKQAEIIKRTGKRMNRMIHDLLDIARIDTGRLEVDEKLCAPRQIVNNAVELMRPLAEERHLLLIETVDEHLPTVSADAERINQVFSNLIGNAIKFTPEGGTITIGASCSDDFVWFSVTDTGPGIPQAQLDNIFGEFWQARKADRRGIGLGLTIAKGIVEAHRGRIGVSSDLGAGTKFWFGIAVAADQPLVS